MHKTATDWEAKLKARRGEGEDTVTLPQLQHIMVLLKALHWNHWTTHWQVMGTSSYGDHLLFERLYQATVEEIDTLAEKMVAGFGDSAVNNVKIAEGMQRVLAAWEKEPDLYHRALHSEQVFQEAIKECYENIKAFGSMSLGLDDFLMSMANTHETHIYLLGQRIGRKLASRVRTAAVVEVPHRFHPVKLEPPKKSPFEGYINFQGIEIDVENKAGSTRSGVAEDGTKWESYMHYHYGEIRGTEGADGDKLDVYVGPNHDSSLVVVIHQVDPDTGKFDEDKVMVGFDSEEEAIGAYKKQYDRPGFYRPGQHTSMPIGAFWRWVKDEKVGASKKAGPVIQMPRRNWPKLTIHGRQYVLSDLNPFVGEVTGEDPRLIQGPGFKGDDKFRFLWVLNTDDHYVTMWQVNDGNEKASGRANQFARHILKLDKLGQMNRVNDQEFTQIAREMNRRNDIAIDRLKEWARELEDDFQRRTNQVARNYFERVVVPKIEDALDAVARGAVPFDFKLNERLVGRGHSKDQQVQDHVLLSVLNKYLTIQAIEDEMVRQGMNLEDGDFQAAQWAMNDLREEALDRYRPKKRMASGTSEDHRVLARVGPGDVQVSAAVRRVSSRYLERQARKFDPSHWGLDGLVRGEPTMLYHGTTASFKAFDMSMSRTDLVDRFYGAGIFLTPSKRVAEKYAKANRNIGFPPSIIDDLRSVNPKAAKFMEALYKRGYKAWDEFSPQALGMTPDEFWEQSDQIFGGDPNTIADVTSWIIGAKPIAEPSDKDYGGGFVNIFEQSTGMPSWVYDSVDAIGLDSKKYRPKVYTVAVKAENVLVTARKDQARNAKKKGYDCVIFHGSGLVDGWPEVAVFDPRKVKILRVEVVD